MLSWEPWNTRLHIPLFYASIPVIVIGFEYKNISKIYTGLTFIVIAQAFYIILTNYSREFIHINKQNSEIGIHANRYEKYFTNRPHLFPEYNQITNYISNHKLEKIGLIIHNDTWEYPLYTKLDEFHVQPIHIEVSNYTTSIHKEKTDPECIVSDTKNKKFIKHNHQKYFNISTKNQFIWLYIPVKK